MSEEERGGSRGQSPEGLGEVAQALLDNRVLHQALSTALGAGERALRAHRSAMDALDLPSASEVQRLERRLRGLSERLEEVEDGLDALGRQVAELREERRSDAHPTADRGGSTDDRDRFRDPTA